MQTLPPRCRSRAPGPRGAARRSTRQLEDEASRRVAALLAADRIAAFSGDAEACAGERRAYCAGGAIPVLDLTGPAMVGDALRKYAGASSNRALREAGGFSDADAAKKLTAEELAQLHTEVT